MYYLNSLPKRDKSSSIIARSSSTTETFSNDDVQKRKQLSERSALIVEKDFLNL